MKKYQVLVIFCFIICFIFISTAQNKGWEIGVGIRPTTLQDDPYTIFIKRHFENRFTLRTGFSLSYISKKEQKYYFYPDYVVDTFYRYGHNITQKENNVNASLMLGVEYNILIRRRGKIFNNLYSYGETGYRYNYKVKPFPFVVFDPNIKIRPGDIMSTSDFGKWKMGNRVFRVGLGLKSILIGNLSFNVESSLEYTLINTLIQRERIIRLPNKDDPSSPLYGVTTFAHQKDKENRLSLNFLSMISIHYSF